MSPREKIPTAGSTPPAATARWAAAWRSASSDGNAVGVRGNPDHPVNRGKLCPKGLSEHYTIDADNRAQYSPAAPERQADARQLGRGTATRWSSAFAPSRPSYGPESLGIVSTGQLVTEEFYTLGKLVAARLWHQQLRRQHHALHGQRSLRLQAFLRQRRPARRLRRPGAAPMSFCSSAPTSPTIIRSSASTWRPIRQRR